MKINIKEPQIRKLYTYTALVSMFINLISPFAAVFQYKVFAEDATETVEEATEEPAEEDVDDESNQEESTDEESALEDFVSEEESSDSEDLADEISTEEVPDENVPADSTQEETIVEEDLSPEVLEQEGDILEDGVMDYRPIAEIESSEAVEVEEIPPLVGQEEKAEEEFETLSDDAEIKDSTEEDWTVEDGVFETKEVVKIGVKYVFPENKKVTVTFTKLPASDENRSTLKIKEVDPEDLPEELRDSDVYAVDITTDMEDGDFEFDLTLPKAEKSKATVSYMEDLDSEVKSVEEGDIDQEESSDSIEIENLNHMTVFVVVNPNPVGNGNTCTVASITGICYDTIQQAINEANDGEDIYVALGVYNEGYISINNKSVNLIGDNATIKATAPDATAVITINNATTLMTIEGFTIDADDVSGRSGIYIQNGSSNITVKDNTIVNFTDKGVLISNSDDNSIEGNSIEGSQSGANAGIYIDNSSEGNSIDDNEVSLPTSGSGNLYDIWFAGAITGNNTVSNNIISGGARAFQQDDGVSGTVTFSGNNIGSTTSPSWAGVYLTGGSAIITGNTITNSVRPIEFRGSGEITITGNTIDGTTYDFINIGDSFTGTLNPIQHNAFLNMGSADLYNRTGSHVDATYNYWGDLDPSDNVNNCGGGSIDYCPWLDTENGNPMGSCLGDLQGRTFVDQGWNGLLLSSDGDYSSGMQDGFTVRLYDGSWSLLEKQTTNTTGNVGQYHFANLDNSGSTYRVCGVDRSGYFHSPAEIGQQVVDTNNSPVSGYEYAEIVANASGNANESPVCWEITLDSETDGAYLGIGYTDQVPGAPTQTGYEDIDGNTFSCTGGYTDATHVRVIWTDESIGSTPPDDLLLYQRQYSTDGGITWRGNEIYSDYYTNYRSFGGGDGEFHSKVRAFYDVYENGQYDNGEPVSNWSNICSITHDTAAPTITLDLPVDDSLHAGIVALKAICNENCDYINFWWRAEGESYSNTSPDRRYHYIYDDGVLFEWSLDTLNAERWGGDPSYVMSDDVYYFYAAGKDMAGNWAKSSEVKIVVDNTAPIVEITSPNDGEIYNTDVTLSGTVTDANPHHYWLKITKDGTNLNIGGVTGEQSATAFNTILTEEGEYHVTFAARDAAGGTDRSGNRSGDINISFTIDKTPPEAPVLTGNSVQYVQWGDVTRSWLPSTSSDVDHYTYKNITNGWTAGPYAAGQSEYNITHTTGNYDRVFEWQVAAVDYAGNKTWSEDIYRVVVDGTKPTVEITNVNIIDKKLSFTVSGTDNLSGARTVGTNIYNEDNSGSPVISIGRLAHNIIPETLSVSYDATDIDVSELESGIYTIRAAVRDYAGNIEYATYQIEVDNTAPTTTFVEDLSGQYFNGPIIIEGQTVDAAGVDFVDLYYREAGTSTWVHIDTIDNTNDNSPFDWNYTWTPSVEGIYDIKAEGTDVLGNIEQSPVMTDVTYDVTIPEVALTTDPSNPDGDNDWFITKPAITLTATDNFDMDRIEYQWGSQTGNWLTYTGPVNPNDEGTTYLYYKAFDKAGNETGIGTKIIKWDKTDPDDNFDVDIDPNPSDDGDATVSWGDTDDNIGIDHYEIDWEHEDGEHHDEEVDDDVDEFDLDNLEEGTWEITVTVYDYAGNSRSESVDLEVDYEEGEVAGVTTASNFGTGGSTLGENNQQEEQGNNIEGEEVLGEETQNVEDQSTSETESKSIFQSFWFWFVLILSVILILFLRRKKEDNTTIKRGRYTN